MPPPPLTLRQLSFLVALEETLHFRRAAEREGVTQPSLSAQLQALEATLGVRLAERGRAGVALTPIGREIAARARRVLEEARGLSELAAGARDGIGGTIRLGAIPTLGPYLMPHVVARLHREHRSLNLYVRESPARELEAELARGDHDLILTQLPIASSETIVERLFREPLRLAMAADDPLAKESTAPLRALNGRKILAMSARHRMHDDVEALCAEHGATLLRDYEGTSLDALRQMAGMGMGLAFLPALYGRSEIKSRDEVVLRPLSGRPLARSIGLAWRKNAGRAPAFVKIAALIREVGARKFGDILILD